MSALCVFLFCLTSLYLMESIEMEIANSNFPNVTEAHICNSSTGYQNLTKENFPNPQVVSEVDYCGRNCTTSWVCDPEHVLSLQDANTLDEKIEEIRVAEVRQCPNCEPGHNSYSISTAIVSKINMNPDYSTDINNAGEHFAEFLRLHKWNFSPCDGDIIIVLSSNEKRVWVSTGDKVKKVLTDECLDDISNAIRIKLSRKEFGDALHQMVDRLRLVLLYKICKIYKFDPSRPDPLPSEALIAGIGVFLVLFCYGAYIIKADLEKKKLKRDLLKRNRKPRRKMSLQQMRDRARRLSELKEEKQKLKNVENSNHDRSDVKVMIKNEDGIEMDIIETDNPERNKLGSSKQMEES